MCDVIFGSDGEINYFNKNSNLRHREISPSSASDMSAELFKFTKKEEKTDVEKS